MARKIDSVQKWGVKTASERYGSGSAGFGNPPDSGQFTQSPQAPEDKHSPGYDNDVPVTAWTRSGNYPNLDKGNAWRGGKLRKD